MLDSAQEVGRLMAERGRVPLNGGRNAGAMAASALGAQEAGGLVIGILPGDDTANAVREGDIATAERPIALVKTFITEKEHS